MTLYAIIHESIKFIKPNPQCYLKISDIYIVSYYGCNIFNTYI